MAGTLSLLREWGPVNTHFESREVSPALTWTRNLHDIIVIYRIDTPRFVSCIPPHYCILPHQYYTTFVGPTDLMERALPFRIVLVSIRVTVGKNIRRLLGPPYGHCL